MEKRKEIRLNAWSILLMISMGVIFYFFLGTWVSIEKDSVAYLYERGREGVLPGYPVFLEFFRSLLGEKNFLNGVVVAQGILAIACTFSFVIVLQKQFYLRNCECILLYLFTMLPFSIYLPEVGITHQIMTEGITYAIFYLYYIMLLKAIWTCKYRWYAGSLVVAFVLALVRSQMLFLQAICLLILLWIVYRRYSCKILKKVLVSCIALVIGMAMAFLSYKMVYKVVAYDNQKVFAKAQEEIQNSQIELNGSVEEHAQEALEEIESGQTQLVQREVTSQFDSLIVSRGFFEADREDVELFEDEMMRQIFLRSYELLDEDKHLYNYAEPGLYMWQDLVYDYLGLDVHQAIMEYDAANPGVRMRSEASIFRELGLRVLFKHFGRYLYHAIRLMLPSFIASVFFQIRPIYLLCHFIALFIYLFAIIGSFWVKKNDGERRVIEYSLSIVLTMVIMVVVINLVFMGLQRYVVYGMGIFYCAMYLLVKEMYFVICKKLKYPIKSM